MGFLRKLFRGPGREPGAGGGPQLMRDCQAASGEIVRYVEARAKKEPSADPTIRDNAAWHQAQNIHALYMMDTMADYRAGFGGRVRALRDGLAAAGITDPELDRLVEHAANPAGIRATAELLAALSRRLDPEVAALERVYAGEETADVE